ncbi:MAG: phosphotransferase [Agrobacterium sp.]|nr:phosphotransferase [Agrobacterium sp.]
MEIERIISEVPLEKGWSNDKKSIVTTPDGRFVRRIIDDSRIHSTTTLFFHIGSLNLDDNPFSRPMELDCTPSPARFYTTTYVEGEDLEEALCKLSQKEQMRLGYEAEFALKKIHTRVRVKDDGMWAIKYNAKIDRKIKAYQECGINVSNDHFLIDRIDSLRIFLEGRPQTFQHGDYHVEISYSPRINIWASWISTVGISGILGKNSTASYGAPILARCSRAPGSTPISIFKSLNPFSRSFSSIKP